MKLIDIDLKEKILPVKYFFIDVYGWIRSLFMAPLQSIKRPAIFYGYSSYFWASMFADRRTKGWKPHWDQAGKKQGVFPADDTKLLVCSALELKAFKKAGIVNKTCKPRKAIKKSYYTTVL